MLGQRFYSKLVWKRSYEVVSSIIGYMESRTASYGIVLFYISLESGVDIKIDHLKNVVHEIRFLRKLDH
jgi:hypothetical protein